MLAVRRCHPLLALMGVPILIAQQPHAAMIEARRLLRLTRPEVISDEDNQYGDSYASYFWAEKEKAWVHLTQTYGIDALHALDAWVERYFLDNELRSCLWGWKVVLSHL